MPTAPETRKQSTHSDSAWRLCLFWEILCLALLAAVAVHVHAVTGHASACPVAFARRRNVAWTLLGLRRQCRPRSCETIVDTIGTRAERDESVNLSSRKTRALVGSVEVVQGGKLQLGPGGVSSFHPMSSQCVCQGSAAREGCTSPRDRAMGDARRGRHDLLHTHWQCTHDKQGQEQVTYLTYLPERNGEQITRDGVPQRYFA